MTDFPPLSAADAVAIGRIVMAAHDQAPLARVVDGRTIAAEARAIVRSGKRTYALGADDDVRDASLWVTADTGFEHFWPLAELVPELTETSFVIYQRPQPIAETVAAADPPVTPVSLSHLDQLRAEQEWLFGNGPAGLRVQAAQELAAEFGTDVREWLI